MKKILLAVLSGILVTFSYPTVFFGWHAPDMGFLGWVAFVPLFIAIRDARPGRAFLVSFLSALIWFSGSVYWVFRAIHVYGGIETGISIAVTVLLIVVLASYTSLAPLVARWLGLKIGGEMLVFIPVAWVAMQYALGHVPMGGFPWPDVTMSQWSNLVSIQIVDITGIYGLMFVMVWTNWFIAELILKISGAEIRWLAQKFAVTALFLVGITGYGLYKLHSIGKMLGTLDSPISVGIAQGNIPQDEKWNPKLAKQNLNVYRSMTAKLFDAGTDLIIWPEASFPYPVAEEVRNADPAALGLPKNLLGDLPAVMFGSDIEGKGNTAYNSALVFDAAGKLLGRYDKSHLVPFGEYVPYKKLLFFARSLVAPIGEFKPGQAIEPIKFVKGSLGPLICFEDVFPSISRELVRKGATLLVNLTNDAWYGMSSASYQHMAFSVMRAVENRRYLVRSTNTGVSAIINPFGETLIRSSLFERALLAGTVASVSINSFYTTNGDWFAWGCIAYILIGCVLGLIIRIRERFRKQYK